MQIQKEKPVILNKDSSTEPGLLLSKHSRSEIFFQKLIRRGVLSFRSLLCWRNLIWKWRGGGIGKGSFLPRHLVTWPHQVQIGKNCHLQPDLFFNYSHFWEPGPSMIFGDRVFLGRGCEFNIRSRLEVGDDCLIASGCIFVDHDHGRDPNMPMNSQDILGAPIVLQRNVWVGARCVVLKGVTIGEGAVIGAGAIVTHSIPAGETWAGIPARCLSPSRVGPGVK